VSKANLELIEAAARAMQRGDREATLDLYDPSAELDMSRMPGGGIYHGPEGAREFFSDWFGAWRDLRFENERVIDLGEQVVVITRITGRGRATGAEVSLRGADVFTFRDGKVVMHVGYPDADDAVEAARDPSPDV
jgi:ketosteroid isomerase-like protein